MRFFKKIDFEVVAYVVAIIAILGFLTLKRTSTAKLSQMAALLEEKSIITEALQLERVITNRKIGGVLLSNADGVEIKLVDLVDSHKLNVIIAVSFNGCSLCRDTELKSWGLLAKDNNGINLQVVVVGDANVDVIALSVEVKSFSGVLPYFDLNGGFLSKLDLASIKTPVVMVVDDEGRAVFAYSTNMETQVRSEKYIEFLNYLSKR